MPALDATDRVIEARRGMRRAAAGVALCLLAACASTPPGRRDGPPEKVPAELANIRDAEPKVEPIRSGGANRPYEVLGREYVPITQDVAFRERGLASWYGRKFHGRRTANGEVYDMFAMTAAHPTLPIPSYARVANPANGRVVVVRINDRGPFHVGRIIDLSYAAAFKLDVLRGVAPVELERITATDIRNGTWKRGLAALPLEGMSPAVAAPGEKGVEAMEAISPVSTMAPTGGFWIQLGAFRLTEGALAFQQRIAAEVDWLEPLLMVYRDDTLYRLQAGPFESRPRAQRAAERIRETLKLVPLIVERP
jgi:rare lipoprotein A